MRRRFYTPVILLVAGLIACGGAQTLRVTSIQLGRSLNADNTVATHTTRFAPDDTVYVSVHTAGIGSGVISARWTYGGQVVGEPKKQVSFRDGAVTEFHLRSGAGFPTGPYKVEVYLDGQSVGTREFRVESKR